MNNKSSNRRNSDKSEKNKSKFNADMSKAFQAKPYGDIVDDKSYLYLNYYIDRTLKQHHIHGKIQVQDVLVEVYLRGIDYIDLDNEIETPLAWARRCALNVIRELSWKNRKEVPNVKHLDSIVDQKYSANEDFELLKISLKQLKSANKEDFLILELRYFFELSWAEVALKLQDKGLTLSTPTLRKRCQRALSKLRAIYNPLSA